MQLVSRQEIDPWVKANTSNLLLGSYRKDIKDHGLWVVYRTYVTKRAAKLVSHGKKKRVLVNVTLKGGQAGNAKLESSYWDNASAEVAPIHSRETDDESVVIFFQGVRLYYVVEFGKGPGKLKVEGNPGPKINRPPNHGPGPLFAPQPSAMDTQPSSAYSQPSSTYGQPSSVHSQAISTYGQPTSGYSTYGRQASSTPQQTNSSNDGWIFSDEYLRYYRRDERGTGGLHDHPRRF